MQRRQCDGNEVFLSLSVFICANYFMQNILNCCNTNYNKIPALIYKILLKN